MTAFPAFAASLFLISTVALAQVPNFEPNGPLVEVGVGYEAAIDEHSENLLVELSLRPRLPGTWGGNPQQHTFRTRIEFSGSVDLDGPGISLPHPGEVPYMRLRFVPVEMVETGTTHPLNVYEATYGFAPVNVSRDLRMGREATLRVNIVSARIGFRQMTDEVFGIIAQAMVEAVGLKVIQALPGSPEHNMTAVDLATLTAGLGMIFRAGRFVTITTYLGVSINSAVGDIAGMGWGYQQDSMGYFQLQADIAGYVMLFARLGATQAIYGRSSGFEVTPGVLQFMAGASVMF